MPITKSKYFEFRSRIMQNKDFIEDLEKFYMGELFSILATDADILFRDFSIQPFELGPFWINYPPEQRGRASSGQGVPWLELGEKTITSHLLRRLSLTYPDISFPGLPTGGDVRFALDDVLIHLDVKLTGPNDNQDEVVVPPNQVSGDGNIWNKNGIENTNFPVYYQRSNQQAINYHFQPKLPPFYVIGDRVLYCLTFFLKGVYDVDDFGVQPLTHFELACVPNGFLMFQAPTNYWDTPNLIISGKDERNKPDDTKRIRIRLNPLSEIASWRCKKLIYTDKGWEERERNTEEK